jgi:hypothetical protein
MSDDDEGFLARWSRRKRGAMQTTRSQATPEGTADDAASDAPATSGQPSPVDPASLPPLDSIGAGSDIRAFLAAGVPAELKRAALRRAWSADPAIRDFVGLSENSWDFNAPDGVPGFGAVTAEDVRRLLERMTAPSQAADPAPVAATTKAADRTPAPASEPDPPGHGPPPEVQMQRGKENAAVQHTSGGHDPILPPRRHGGALPE